MAVFAQNSVREDFARRLLLQALVQLIDVDTVRKAVGKIPHHALFDFQFLARGQKILFAHFTFGRRRCRRSRK